MMINETTFFIILFSFFGFEILIAVIVLWTEIMSFFMPHNYTWFSVKLNNNHLFQKLVSRKKNDIYTFKDFDYCLYYPPEIKPNPLYKGRVLYLMFNQNNKFPLDFSDLKVCEDETFKEDLKKQEFNELWVEEFSIGDFFSKNIIAILAVVGLIIVVIILISKGDTSQVVNAPLPQ